MENASVSEKTAIDLFCGAGGLSEGFRQAGYHILAGNDHDEAAGETFARTHRDARYFGGPIEQIEAGQFLRAGGLRRGELDILIGGPPCQGYSVYNHQRGLHDNRSALYVEYLRIVDGLNPKWVVVENVTGITSAGGGAAVEAIISGLQARGYAVECRILKAEQYGIPQERRRILFIGNRIGVPNPWPRPTHGPGLKPYVTVGDAISDLPVLTNGQESEMMTYLSAPQSPYQRILRVGSKTVANHSAARLAAINIERLRHIPPGGSWRDIPFGLLPAGMKRAKRSDHTKRYGRLSWDGLASTVLTKCDPHWGAYFHPDQDRTITVREAARLQSFPDVFHFSGSRTEQYVQVGNAVPPLLGKHIAKAIIGSSAARTNVAALAAAE